MSNNINLFSNATVNAANCPSPQSNGGMKHIELCTAKLSAQSKQIITVEKLYQENKIIAHSLDDYHLQDIADHEKPIVTYYYLGSLFSELMSEGIRDLSSTLLVQGKNVATYRANGILFNANLAKPVSITKGDGNTCIDSNRNIKTNNSLSSLNELVDYVLRDEPGRPPMNEVKGFFPGEALVGLYFRKAPNNTSAEAENYLKMLLLQKKIAKDYSLFIPIFQYDEKNGNLEKANCSCQCRFNAYLKVKQLFNNSGKVIANTIAETLEDKKPF